ncbi:hypothetical protein MPTK1_8g09490 [Marchantia polymorpha subsp. ruderalis]|uniref:Alpha-carbonic anhydrase domain-containing protein n=1 Tax=Marchantia polymorpha TaxID=3197 RepID=A0A2R6VYW9_MARPO|nr:hypothetical protein MARPO_0359s0002 [Marchantia polymorpha]BBN19303.1 hypothetical protein Mp_8g09490 [Marchantia polymorpha subsp. ruderalis]|eukprot:PTQ26798.1 hypothetical protein MARPO_0359s0002 [Marchantia polymorpha]
MSYDLELHLVHKTVTQNGPQLAVIGLLYNEGPDDSSTDHFLQQVFDALPYIKKADSSVHTFKSVDFSSLLPVLDGPYARYTGSLTTPPCTENVTWTVMLNQLRHERCLLHLSQRSATLDWNLIKISLHDRHCDADLALHCDVQNLKMSPRQFQAYKAVLKKPNNRPLQDLAGRTVMYSQ